MNTTEFKRKMSVGRTGGSTVAQRAQDTYTIKHTNFTKPKFVLILGIWMVEENGVLRQPTTDEFLEHFKGIAS